MDDEARVRRARGCFRVDAFTLQSVLREYGSVVVLLASGVGGSDRRPLQMESRTIETVLGGLADARV